MGKFNKYDKPSTYSLLVRDIENKKLGVITQSKYLAIGSLIHFFDKKSGIIVIQGWPNSEIANEYFCNYNSSLNYSIENILKRDQDKEYRQIGICPIEGDVYSYTGDKLNEIRGSILTKDSVAIGNFLSNNSVLKDMTKAYIKNYNNDSMLNSLMYALESALDSGGEKRGQQSAAVKIWDLNENSDIPNIDLRIDDNEDAVEELHKLVEKYNLYFDNSIKNIIKIDRLTIKRILSNASKYYNSELINESDTSLYKLFRIENLENKWISNFEINEDIYNYFTKKFDLL